VPGLWVPALLYEPESISGRVPGILNVNGHDSKGNAVPYNQIRCINLAKRGMVSLLVEWFGFGQLENPGFEHFRMNQLDLCGTSGLAVFYLTLERALDVLTSQEHVDPARVAVTGLSGGGWQTILISSLDTRVKLANPVAGYSSFLTRLRHSKDLGDSEQMPCDFATIADYIHLTALMAPRPILLTYCSKDECCFEAGYAMAPLLEAVTPIFKLFNKEEALRWHVNHDPGTHNYEQDNREAFYRMLGDHFYPDDPTYFAREIPCAEELKTAEELAVKLPAENVNFNTLSRRLGKLLPHSAIPVEADQQHTWQQQQRIKLREIVRVKDYSLRAIRFGSEDHSDYQARFWLLKFDNLCTLPAVELIPDGARATVILISDRGRGSETDEAGSLIAEGYRVFATDLLFFGEAVIEHHNHLFGLLTAAIGDRPLGIQASQLMAIARRLHSEHNEPVSVCAIGARSGLVALIAAGLETEAIRCLKLHGSLRSLKEIIEDNKSAQQVPEMFCFGLLEAFDIEHLTALVAPRPVEFRS
jgi:dienelactone hydrolase